MFCINLIKQRWFLKKHCLIDVQLLWLIFNYSKFYAIHHFVKYIYKYRNAINYDTVYSKTAYKYLFKVFYKGENKKEYELQILQYNIYHINILAINNTVIVIKKG